MPHCVRLGVTAGNDADPGRQPSFVAIFISQPETVQATRTWDHGFGDGLPPPDRTTAA
jgi:hypothetical protein